MDLVLVMPLVGGQSRHGIPFNSEGVGESVPAPVSVPVSFRAVHDRSGETRAGSRSLGQPPMNPGEPPNDAHHPTPAVGKRAPAAGPCKKRGAAGAGRLRPGHRLSPIVRLDPGCVSGPRPDRPGMQPFPTLLEPTEARWRA